MVSTRDLCLNYCDLCIRQIWVRTWVRNLKFGYVWMLFGATDAPKINNLQLKIKLSRQRSRVRAPSSPPLILEFLDSMASCRDHLLNARPKPQAILSRSGLLRCFPDESAELTGHTQLVRGGTAAWFVRICSGKSIRSRMGSASNPAPTAGENSAKRRRSAAIYAQ